VPYTQTVWTNGVTAANQSHMSNLEQQYTEAVNSFEQELFTPFVFSGLVCSKDGTHANQLDVTSGIAFLLQSDNTLRRRATAASTTGQFTTSTHNTTYYLDLNVDGTFSFGTSHSGTANYLTICQLTTDGSGNISTVTDERQLNTTMFSGAAGSITINNSSGQINADSGQITSDGSGNLTVGGDLDAGGGIISGTMTFNRPQSGSDSQLMQWQASDASPAARWTLNSRHSDSSLLLADNTNGAKPIYFLTSGSLSFNNSGSMSGINSFSGSSSGTFTHGLSATPTSCWVTQNVSNSTDTVGSDSYGSSTIHVNINGSFAFTAGVHKN
jgi:hypothetical protein